MLVERDLLLEKEGRFSPVDRNEIAIQLRDSMRFLINESCDKFEEDEIRFNNHMRGEEVYITRNRDTQMYEVGILGELYQEAFIFEEMDLQETFYYVSHMYGKEDPFMYRYSMYPEIAFNNITRIVSIVIAYFNEEALEGAYEYLQENGG